MSVSIEGLPQLLAKFDALGGEAPRIANASLNAVALNIAASAKLQAPAAFGKIRQGIITEQTGELQYAVISTAPESPFQEFGTGGKVSVPDQLSDVASSFQGARGGGMQAFIQSLIDWIKLRGLTNTYSIKTHRVSKRGTADENEQLAWAIAKKILRDGLTPQPFLWPAFMQESPKLIPMLEKAFQELLRSKQS